MVSPDVPPTLHQLIPRLVFCFVFFFSLSKAYFRLPFWAFAPAVLLKDDFSPPYDKSFHEVISMTILNIFDNLHLRQLYNFNG